MKKYVTLIAFLIFSSVFIQTTFAGDLTINSNTTWVSGSYTYDNVLITNGATLIFNGAITLNARNLTIDLGASLSTNGKGYPATQGHGAGTTDNQYIFNLGTSSLSEGTWQIRIEFDDGSSKYVNVSCM